MELILNKGEQYLVKTNRDNKMVRRIFKGTEQRFDEILCYVFTSQVSSKTKCEVEETKNGVTFFRYSGAKKYPSQELSVPFYNIQKINSCTDNSIL